MGSAELLSKAFYVLLVFHPFFIACCTALLMLHITRMTKAILRAIDVRKP
jgi:hypothetical protein